MNLYAHQQQVLDEAHLPERKKFGNFRGTGSGKTRGTVAIAEGRTLVLCPKTQAQDQIWEREWEFQGRDPHDLIVLSYDQFKIKFNYDPESVHGYHRPQTVILDECHKCAGVTADTKQKNYVKYPKTSAIFDCVLRYIQLVRPDRIHPLSATPAPQPMALWAIGKLLGHNWDYFKFREAFYYEAEIRGYTRWLPKFRRKIWKGSKPEIAAFIRKQKEDSIALAAKTKERIGYIGKLEDWNDVPDQIFKDHKVGVTGVQEEKYKELKILYPDPLVQAGKRQMLEQGIFEGSIIAENKTDAIRQYADEFGRIIVFCRYTDQIEHYKKEFEDDYKVFVLNGQTKNRKAVLDEAKQTDEYIFIAQSSISAGWELPECPCVVFASMDYSYVNYDQALGRVQRSNNIKKNTYIFLIAGKGDLLVKEVISEKQEFSEARYAEELCKSAKLQ